MAERVLVVDDQPAALRALANELEDAGFDVAVARDGAEAWESFCSRRPAAVVTDLVMPNGDGMELLGRIREQSDVPVILFSAHGSIETAVSALKAGADDFVPTTRFDADRLVQMVRDAIDPASSSTTLAIEERLVGESPFMVAARRRLEGLAPLGTPVLVVGEPGVGCSTAIQALHDLGSSRSRSLCRIDAGDFGARTPVRSLGAIHLRGALELTVEAQSFLLRKLRAGPEGGAEPFPRVFVSSREPLAHVSQEGALDPELAHILARFEVRIPPLRDRLEDVPELARVLIDRACARIGRRRMRISPRVMAYLQAQEWPGNVTELETVLERAVAYSRGRDITKSTVEDVVADLAENLASLRATRERRQRQSLIDALRRTGGNITQTAELLGKSRSAVYRLIEKHGIRLTREG